MDVNEVYNMDCLGGLQKLEPNSVDLVVTDPPYFLPINSYVGTRQDGYNRRTLADTSVLKGYFERIFEQLERVIKKDGTYYVFCDGQSYPIFYQIMFPLCKYVRPLVWDKLISYNGYTWRHQHELIAWGEQEKSKRVPTGDGDIIKCRGVLQKDRSHPAEKPVKLIRRLIEKHIEPDARLLILDPYLGSGSTAVAAKQLGQAFMGYELNEDYCTIAKKRVDAVAVRNWWADEDKRGMRYDERTKGINRKEEENS